MAVVLHDQELEALEEEERQLELQLAKQEKLQQIAAKQKQLDELMAANGGAAGPLVTKTTTLTVKKSTYQEHSESASKTKSSGIGIGYKGAELGYNESKGTTAEVQWKKSENVEGSLPINLNNPSGGGVDHTQAFLAAMGVSAEQINALKDK